MRKKILWITETAAMLALLVCLQWVGSQIPAPMVKQLVTGSCVNAVLAVTALLVGLSGGLVVAVVSPVLAYALGIAPQILTVPAIMVGNALYVVVLYLLSRKALWQRITAWVLASVAKFAALYTIVVVLICGVFSEKLLAAGTLKAPMLKALPATFSWPQLVTALIGGALALLILPVLRKALHK